MWPNISFFTGFKSTILENENHAVNGGHIVKIILQVRVLKIIQIIVLLPYSGYVMKYVSQYT